MSPSWGNDVVLLSRDEWLQTRVNAKAGADHFTDSIHKILEFHGKRSCCSSKDENKRLV